MDEEQGQLLSCEYMLHGATAARALGSASNVPAECLDDSQVAMVQYIASMPV